MGDVVSMKQELDVIKEKSEDFFFFLKTFENKSHDSCN